MKAGNYGSLSATEKQKDKQRKGNDQENRKENRNNEARKAMIANKIIPCEFGA